MISVRVHKHLKYAIFFALGFFCASILGGTLAMAADYNPFPYSFNTGDFLTLNINNNNFVGTFHLENSFTYASTHTNESGISVSNNPVASVYVYDADILNTTFIDRCVSMTNGVFNINANIPSGSYGEIDVVFSDPAFCATETDEEIIQGSLHSMTFSYWDFPFTVSGTTHVVGRYSFVRPTDFSTAQMLTSVQNGAQASMSGFTSPLALIGIPLAFIILLALINMIRQSAEEKRKKKGGKTVVNPDGEDFIYHSAEDLEFKREYGKHKRE